MSDPAVAPPVLRGLILGDPPQLWEQLGFVVVGDHVRLGQVWVRLAGVGGGIVGWQLDPPVEGPVDGLTAATAVPPGATDDPPAAMPSGPPGHPDGHPNGVTGIDHLVVATPDHERTAAALARLGLRPRRTVDGARGDVETRYRFTLLGSCLLEVIGPVIAADRDPRSARFVGLALVADDLTGFGAHASAPKPAVQPGRHIVTLRTRELGGEVPIAVLTPRVPHA